MTDPLHRIQRWTGSFFRSAYLWEIGAYIMVPHRDQELLCQPLTRQKTMLELLQSQADNDEQLALAGSNWEADADVSVDADAEWTSNDDDIPNEDLDDGIKDRDAEFDADVHDHAGAKGILTQDALSNHYVRIVHQNGVHHLPLIACTCDGPDALYGNLMYCRLVPATFSHCKTLFTIQVLDDFRLLNLECKVSAYQYFHKLCRLTYPMSPSKTPNFYKELLRMSRLWRWLKKRKWAGHGYPTDRLNQPRTGGELANYCPTCPQPGVNLPPNWKEDQNRLFLVRYW